MKVLSEFYSDDMSRKAVVKVLEGTLHYFIDHYKDDVKVITYSYPGKSLHYCEEVAENWVLNIKVLDVN